MSAQFVAATPFMVAQRFVGLQEVVGAVHNPAVVAMLQLVDPGVKDDETAWCSAFANYCCWILGVKRSRSLSARSWLKVGFPVGLKQAAPGFHVVVLKRGGGNQPGPEVLAAPGHVGFFHSRDPQGRVGVLAGNQGNAVSVAYFEADRVLGVRDLY